ncbi:MAG TPA: Yip1 family protein, partial [Acidiferrobacterales bacterium]|nr:Yip1 family protein [Acidiferrobacterales bacterium]
MVLNHVWGLFFQPKKEWKSIKGERCSIGKCYCSHVLILAAIPAIAGYIGTTQVGWSFGGFEVHKLTTQSALQIAILTYLTMLVAVFSLGKAIHWMGQTYGSKQTLPQAIALAAYTATPLWLMGFFFLYPVLWVNMLIGLPALAYTVYLLYTGVPVMMSVSQERGFLFASAVLAVGLVMLVAVLGAMAMLWSMGIGPEVT